MSKISGINNPTLHKPENKSIIPENETERIKTLKRYEILDTPPDGSFDRITAIASKLLNVPIVIISLVDEDRIWFKSKFGLDVEQINRDPGLCASAILNDNVYMITNAIDDPRSLANPLVAGDFGLRFYAAAPLKTKDSFNLGTLCVLDKQPRELTKSEMEILENLAGVVMDEMELRLASRKAYNLHRELLSIAAHDLKSPLSGILEASNLLKVEKEPEIIVQISNLISDTSKRMIHIVSELLESNYLEEGKMEIKLVEVEFSTLIDEVINSNKILANQKNQKFKVDIKPDITIYGDESRMREVLDNLINNAIKYSPQDTDITIRLNKTDNYASLEIIDQGQGLSEDDKNNLFKKFCRLSSTPTGGESQTGLGLSIVKTLVELHKGKIIAESEGKNKGTKFVLTLPAK